MISTVSCPSPRTSDSREDIDTKGVNTPGGFDGGLAELSLIIVLSSPCLNKSHLSHWLERVCPGRHREV